MSGRLSSVALLALGLSQAALGQSVIQGVGQAKDGDSLLVGGIEVRLFGIDAPEWGQSCKRDEKSWDCGAAAAEALARLVSGKSVMCWTVGTDDFQRTLARCSAGKVDVNRTLVSQGMAVAFRKYSNDYVSAELEAKAARQGLWAGEFQMPEDYRHVGSSPTKPRNRATQAAKGSARSSDWAGRAKADCNIKGNRNRRGQWIYHLPGMPYYDQTRPEEIFCTEAEARAAGYRRAIVK
jgi:endonuclease YncB( thermonuclease family)